jgi:hypothetical protein
MFTRCAGRMNEDGLNDRRHKLRGQKVRGRRVDAPFTTHPHPVIRHNYLCRLGVHSYSPSIRSQRGMYWPDFQPMRVPEEPVCINLFRQNPVFTSLHSKSPVHVVPTLSKERDSSCSILFNFYENSKDDIIVKFMHLNIGNVRQSL